MLAGWASYQSSGDSGSVCSKSVADDRVAYGSMVAGDWASIALPVELDASGTGAAVVEAPLAPVNLQQIEANDLDKVPTPLRPRRAPQSSVVFHQ